MRKELILTVCLLFSKNIFAQNEIGPEGDKLLKILMAIVFLAALFLILEKVGKRKTGDSRRPFVQFKNVLVELEKDRIYFPDFLKLSVKNTGTADLDLDKPLLIFDNFWLKRKFQIKGMENRTFYPLYLARGKSHSLNIDIKRFYAHDKRLKSFPKVKVIIRDVKGKRLGGKSVYLRKTLFKF